MSDPRQGSSFNLDSRGRDSRGVRPRVFVYGPFAPPSVPCGITSAFENLRSSRLADRYEFRVVSTYRGQHENRGTLQRLLYGAWLGVSSFSRFARERPDLVEVHSASGRDFLKHAAILLAARLSLRPLILRLHGGEFDVHYRRASAFERFVIRAGLRLPTRVVLLTASWVTAIAAIEPRSEACAIPNSVDFRAYSGELIDEVSAPRSAEGIGGNVLMLGNLCHEKGHFDALDAVAEVVRVRPEAQFVFAGSEREQGALAALEERADALGVRGNVLFPGVVLGADKYAALAAADVFILPSHIENMPMSIIEAMAAGLPVVASRVGGIPEMIQDGHSGVLVSAGDPAGLARELVELLGNASRRREMGVRAQAVAQQRWDVEPVLELNAALFQELLAANTPV